MRVINDAPIPEICSRCNQSSNCRAVHDRGKFDRDNCFYEMVKCHGCGRRLALDEMDYNALETTGWPMCTKCHNQHNVTVKQSDGIYYGY